MILLLVALFVLSLVFLWRKQGSLIQDRSPGALGLLQERYVKGEISKEEYLEMKSVLTQK